MCVLIFSPFYLYSQTGQMAGPAEQITIKFTLQFLLSGGNWWTASFKVIMEEKQMGRDTDRDGLSLPRNEKNTELIRKREVFYALV